MLQISEETVEIMSDNQLKACIPKYGDTVARRSFIAIKRENLKRTETRVPRATGRSPE